MLKLLQICVEGNRGSTGTIAEAIGETAINENWESYIACGRFIRPSKSIIIRIGNKLDVLFHVAISRLFDIHGFGSTFATHMFIRKIKKIKPDIIHLHHLHGYYINIRVLFDYLNKSNIPIVWTFHDCWSFTGHCSFFEIANCDKWKIECNNCPQIKEYPQSLIFDRSKINYNLKKEMFTSPKKMVIVSVSKWLDSLVSQSFFKNSNHIFIHNGVNVEVFKPKEPSVHVANKLNIKDKCVILGVATTWDRRKGLKDFIKLSEYLRSDEVIILIGLDEMQMRDLPKNIIGLPKTENISELVDLYNLATVFLNLSVEETFGLTTAEAISCGTPVIVYNNTASPELVTPESGFILEKENFDHIITAISKIRENGKESYRKNCRELAIAKYNMKTQYTKYINLYNKILNHEGVN